MKDFETEEREEMRDEFEALKRAILLAAKKAKTLDELRADIAEIFGEKPQEPTK